MGSKSKIFLIGLIIAAILAGGLYYFLREKPPEEPSQPRVVTRMAFTGSKLEESVEGKKVWDMNARSIEVDGKTQWLYLTDLQGTFYRADGTKIDVTAKNGVVDPKTRNIEMTGDIVMKASDGPSFNAEKANYLAKDRKIFATGSIRAVKDDYILTANELETDDRFALIVIKGNARIVKGGPTQ